MRLLSDDDYDDDDDDDDDDEDDDDNDDDDVDDDGTVTPLSLYERLLSNCFSLLESNAAHSQPPLI